MGPGRREPPGRGGCAPARCHQSRRRSGLAPRLPLDQSTRVDRGVVSGVAHRHRGATWRGSPASRSPAITNLWKPDADEHRRAGEWNGRVRRRVPAPAEGLDPVLYDQNPYWGGHTASFRHPGGFIFDQGPHISFTKEPRIQDLFAENVNQEYETVQINLNNYWRGYWPAHPVQLHLHGLAGRRHRQGHRRLRRGAPRCRSARSTNYADWLLASFGATFAELFPMQYTRKYHLTTAENMSTDWLGPRIYRPSLEEVLRGALSARRPDPLHHPLPLPDARAASMSYLKKLVPLSKINSESPSSPGSTRGPGSSPSRTAPRSPTMGWCRRFRCRSWFPMIAGRASRRRGGGGPPGLLDLRAGQPRA